jgi:acyl-CoA synthetase (AMP-forming)/AMP-acid ligase II
MCGGAAIAPSLIERAERVGIRAFRSWGMTEAPTVGLIGPDDPLELRATRDGRLSEGCEVEAVDDARRPLPPGELGELRLRCPEQMLGYTDAAVDAEQVDGDGWFYTGDVGRVDADGWVTMTGRLKDVVNRGGEKFSAQDIEHAISSHPAVGAVAVTGLPDERLGECVAAFVVLRPGASWPGPQALLDHLEAQKLARAKFPAVWRVVEELPMTMSGKVQKNRLVQLWESENPR